MAGYRLYRGKGYYPMPYRVAADPAARALQKDQAAARKAHREGRPHHQFWCSLCQRAGITTCALCGTIGGRDEATCLVRG